MTRRNPPAKWVLPTIVNPPKRRCFIIEVPDEIFHIAAFRGAILNLAAATQWGDDPAHTAKEVALVWRGVYDKIHACPPPARPILYLGDDMLLRQNPDNLCKLETSIDGVHWCDTGIDFSLCLSGGQPGAGAEQPPAGGGEACYPAVLGCNNIWLLPTLVSTGDVIDVTGASGAGSWDGGLDWTCPDGHVFLGGICLGVTSSTNAGNPMPALPTNQLIVSIGGTYYDAMAGPLTVPSGFSNAVVTFLCNDIDRTDNAGTYSFQVCVTNNATPVTTYDVNIDYRDSPGGPVYGSGPAGVNVGDVFVVNSQVTSGNVNMYMIFDKHVKVQILGSSGYVPYAPSGSNFCYSYMDTSGTYHVFYTNTAPSIVTSWDPTIAVQRMGCVSNNSVFTLTLVITAIVP